MPPKPIYARVGKWTKIVRYETLMEMHIREGCESMIASASARAQVMWPTAEEQRDYERYLEQLRTQRAQYLKTWDDRFAMGVVSLDEVETCKTEITAKLASFQPPCCIDAWRGKRCACAMLYGLKGKTK